MEIRKIKEGELDQLVRLFDAYLVFYEKESNVGKAKGFLEERIKNKESQIFVAVTEAGVLTGFVQLYPLFSSTRLAALWMLNDLFVDPDYRGKGIAKKLIEESKKLCRSTQACGLLLDTAKSNKVGNSLYPSTGFNLNTSYNQYFWNND